MAEALEHADTRIIAFSVNGYALINQADGREKMDEATKNGKLVFSHTGKLADESDRFNNDIMTHIRKFLKCAEIDFLPCANIKGDPYRLSQCKGCRCSLT